MKPQTGSFRRWSFLFVSPFCAPFVGGASTFLEAMTSRLAAAGHAVAILTTDAHQASDFWLPPPQAGPRLPPREERNGVVIERLALEYLPPAPYAFGVLRRLSHRLSRSGLPEEAQRRLLNGLARWMPPLPGLSPALQRLVPAADLVQALDSSWDGMFTAAGAAAARHGEPLVAMPLMHLGLAGVQTHYQMAHQVELYRVASAILALSQREADAYAALGAATDRIRVIGMGIDPVSPSPDPGEVAAFRDRLALRGPLVAFLGANTYDKGAFTLTEAVARLNAVPVRCGAGEPVTLICAGPLSQGLEAHVAGLAPGARAALAGHLHIMGAVDEPTKRLVLAASDLLALPSRVDAFGIVILEAWLHDKPVIGADAGGIPELVEGGKTGLLVPFGDADALADAIRLLVSDQALAGRMGRTGHERARCSYTWDRTYETLARIYAEVLHDDAGR